MNLVAAYNLPDMMCITKVLDGLPRDFDQFKNEIENGLNDMTWEQFRLKLLEITEPPSKLECSNILPPNVHVNNDGNTSVRDNEDVVMSTSPVTPSPVGTVDPPISDSPVDAEMDQPMSPAVLGESIDVLRGVPVLMGVPVLPYHLEVDDSTSCDVSADDPSSDVREVMLEHQDASGIPVGMFCSSNDRSQPPFDDHISPPDDSQATDTSTITSGTPSVFNEGDYISPPSLPPDIITKVPGTTIITPGCTRQSVISRRPCPVLQVMPTTWR